MVANLLEKKWPSLSTTWTWPWLAEADAGHGKELNGIICKWLLEFVACLAMDLDGIRLGLDTVFISIGWDRNGSALNLPRWPLLTVAFFSSISGRTYVLQTDLDLGERLMDVFQQIRIWEPRAWRNFTKKFWSWVEYEQEMFAVRNAGEGPKKKGIFVNNLRLLNDP